MNKNRKLPVIARQKHNSCIKTNSSARNIGFIVLRTLYIQQRNLSRCLDLAIPTFVNLSDINHNQLIYDYRDFFDETYDQTETFRIGG